MRSRLALRLDRSTLTRPPSTFSTSVRPFKLSTSPMISTQRCSSVGTSIGAVETVGDGAGAGVDAGTTVGAAPLADARVSLIGDFGEAASGWRTDGVVGGVAFGAAGGTPALAGATTAAGGAEVTGALSAGGRTPCNCARAASAVDPLPTPMAVTS